MNQSVRLGAYGAVLCQDTILLVVCEGTRGRFYHLPGGGVEVGESLHEALRRELEEEVCVHGVRIGELICVWEYAPKDAFQPFGLRPQLELVFRCTLPEGASPRMPQHPDPTQVGVAWVALEELARIPLVPNIEKPLLEALAKNQSAPFVKDTGTTP